MPLVPVVGVVGLGAMGRPIAGHLVAAGVRTLVHDSDGDVAASIEGAEPVADLGAIAVQAAVVLIVVPTDDDVLVVGDAMLAAARRGAVLVICSSVRPDTCRELGERAGAAGVDVLDAALTGGVRAAESGDVNLLVGGDAGVLERVRPALDPWTGSVHLLGGLGAGQVAKTVNNLCHWGQLSVVVEALRLGRALGVEPELLRPALLDGPAASRTLAEMQLMRLAWPAKDLANAFTMADTVHQPMPVAAAVREAMRHTSVDDIAGLYG